MCSLSDGEINPNDDVIDSTAELAAVRTARCEELCFILTCWLLLWNLDLKYMEVDSFIPTIREFHGFILEILLNFTLPSPKNSFTVSFHFQDVLPARL